MRIKQHGGKTVNQVFKEISKKTPHYNALIENIRSERGDLLDRVLDEDANDNIVSHLYRGFKGEIQLVNDFYERLQSFYVSPVAHN